MDLPKMRNELNAQRRKVSFNTYDITVDELVRRVATKKIEVAPSYQREFRLRGMPISGKLQVCWGSR